MVNKRTHAFADVQILAFCTQTGGKQKGNRKTTQKNERMLLLAVAAGIQGHQCHMADEATVTYRHMHRDFRRINVFVLFVSLLIVS